MPKVVLALSGGMDSATLLAWLLKDGAEVVPVIFSYGSKHNSYENEAARKVAVYYHLTESVREIDLSEPFSHFSSNLLMSGGEIPEGHYTDETMSKTVVPGRNIIFTSLMAGLAWSIGAEFVALGIHSGDHAIYADCREEFAKAMDRAVFFGTDRSVKLISPFVGWDKTQILIWGIPRGVPYHLTRTCYKDQLFSCGKCGSCVERLEAFKNIGVPDPIRYQK